MPCRSFMAIFRRTLAALIHQYVSRHPILSHQAVSHTLLSNHFPFAENDWIAWSASTNGVMPPALSAREARACKSVGASPFVADFEEETVDGFGLLVTGSVGAVDPDL
jgi:hypothetical protein